MEKSFWALVQGERRQETRPFEDPAHPGFIKTVTFQRMTPSERLAADAEARQLAELHLQNGEPWGLPREPVGLTAEGIRMAMTLRWHQPEGQDAEGKPMRWEPLEWIGMLVHWDKGFFDVLAFADEMDGFTGGDRPLAKRDTGSPEGAEPGSTPESGS